MFTLILAYWAGVSALLKKQTRKYAIVALLVIVYQTIVSWRNSPENIQWVGGVSYWLEVLAVIALCSSTVILWRRKNRNGWSC